MKNTKFNLAVILLILGFVLIALDWDVKTGFAYPEEYANSKDVIGEFQYYNIASNYGATCTYKFIDTSTKENSNANDVPGEHPSSSAVYQQTKVIDKVFFDNIHIDIFNDLPGFLFIAVACLILGTGIRRFRLAALSAICGMVLFILLKALPFAVNGLLLCNISMVIGIAYLGINTLTIYLCVNALLHMCPDVCCRDERKWCRIVWFMIFVLQILVTFILWLGSDFSMLFHVGIFFEGVLVAFIIIFWLILKRVFYYIENTYFDALKKKSKNLR